MTIVSDEVLAALVAEFGDGAPAVAERALRGEITRHRISVAVRAGADPATAVADALAQDRPFLVETDKISEEIKPASALDDRLRRWA